MKQITFIRHGETEHTGYDNDFTRQLTERGHNDAVKVSAELDARNISPDYIIASPATRAFNTASIFAEQFGYSPDHIQAEERLYFDYSPGEFIDVIKTIDDRFQSLFVFGHNPFMFFISDLMSKNFTGDMPTCSSVVLKFNIDSWQQIEARMGDIILHLTPKMLRI